MAKRQKRRIAAWWADSNRREYYAANKNSTRVLTNQIDTIGTWFLPDNEKLKSVFSDMLEKEKYDLTRGGN